MDKYYRYCDGALIQTSAEEYRVPNRTSVRHVFSQKSGKRMSVLADARDGFADVMAAAMKLAGDDSIVSSKP